MILGEMLSGSKENWNDDSRAALERASETDELLDGVEVLHSTAVSRDGRVVAYHVHTRPAAVADRVVAGAPI